MQWLGGKFLTYQPVFEDFFTFFSPNFRRSSVTQWKDNGLISNLQYVVLQAKLSLPTFVNSTNPSIFLEMNVIRKSWLNKNLNAQFTTSLRTLFFQEKMN
jgi:hypothetical protein